MILFISCLQVGTAILIIYSTFAAIYYSKVNPLVSDYDYTDYLGGARSLSGGDLDFVDDTNNNEHDFDDDNDKISRPHWYDNLLPRVGHSVKFILDALDKLPLNDAIANENINTTNAAAAAAGDDDDDTEANDSSSAYVTNEHAT